MVPQIFTEHGSNVCFLVLGKQVDRVSEKLLNLLAYHILIWFWCSQLLFNRLYLFFNQVPNLLNDLHFNKIDAINDGLKFLILAMERWEYYNA